jgi:hypothetical protein
MKKYTIPVISFLIGVGGLTAYMMIGSKISPSGILIEPF